MNFGFVKKRKKAEKTGFPKVMGRSQEMQNEQTRIYFTVKTKIWIIVCLFDIFLWFSADRDNIKKIIIMSLNFERVSAGRCILTHCLHKLEYLQNDSAISQRIRLVVNFHPRHLQNMWIWDVRLPHPHKFLKRDEILVAHLPTFFHAIESVSSFYWQWLRKQFVVFDCDMILYSLEFKYT